MKLCEFHSKVHASLPSRPALDPAFLPAHAFLTAYEAGLTDANSVPLALAVERENECISSFRMRVYADENEWGEVNRYLVERLVKTMLWAYGGWRVFVGGPAYLGEYIKAVYAPGGARV